MTLQNTATETSDYKYNRAVRPAMLKGVKSKCPNCGEGHLYNGFLEVNEACDVCNEELHHHRADDLPPYLNLFIVGHLVVGVLMISMKYEWFGMWTTAIGGSIIAMILAFALMRPIKGMVVGLQWALEMHGFGDEADEYQSG